MSEPLKLDLSGGKAIYALTQVPAAFCIGGQTLIGYPGKHAHTTGVCAHSSSWSNNRLGASNGGLAPLPD